MQTYWKEECSRKKTVEENITYKIQRTEKNLSRMLHIIEFKNMTSIKEEFKWKRWKEMLQGLRNTDE